MNKNCSRLARDQVIVTSSLKCADSSTDSILLDIETTLYDVLLNNEQELVGLTYELPRNCFCHISVNLTWYQQTKQYFVTIGKLNAMFIVPSSYILIVYQTITHQFGSSVK